MGLDMYLKKTKRIEAFGDDVSKYNHIDDSLQYMDLLTYWEENGEELIDFNEFFNTHEPLASADQMALLKDRYAKRYQSFDGPLSNSIWERVHSWRKANQIHNWFVENVQGGVDECHTYVVSRSQFESLLEDCQYVAEHNFDPEIAQEVLPTVSGFFFGSTDYDDVYQEDVEETINVINNILDTTDFEKEIITYQSSW